MLRKLVYENGEVCISILHPPGEDKWGYERPEERWLPVHSVETILISVISMLSDPNDQSPANIEAAVRFYLIVALYASRTEPFPVFRNCGARTVKPSKRE